MSDKPIVLDTEERRKFAEYLLMEAETNDGLISQMERLSGGTLTALIRKLKSEAAAARIVALMLDGEEEVLR